MENSPERDLTPFEKFMRVKGLSPFNTPEGGGEQIAEAQNELGKQIAFVWEAPKGIPVPHNDPDDKRTPAEKFMDVIKERRGQF